MFLSGIFDIQSYHFYTQLFLEEKTMIYSGHMEIANLKRWRMLTGQ